MAKIKWQELLDSRRQQHSNKEKHMKKDCLGYIEADTVISVSKCKNKAMVICGKQTRHVTRHTLNSPIWMDADDVPYTLRRAYYAGPLPMGVRL